MEIYYILERFFTCDFDSSFYQQYRRSHECCDAFKRKIHRPSEEVTSLEVHTLIGDQGQIKRDRKTERRRKI
jgi:hypothetical protein